MSVVSRLKSKHSPRVEFIEHLKLMNLNELDKQKSIDGYIHRG